MVRRFLALVFLFSFPLWLVAALFDMTTVIPIQLPLSALQFLSVGVAAVIVTRKRHRSVAELLARSWDRGWTSHPFWRVGVFVVMPLVVLVSLGLSVVNGLHLSRATPLISLAVFLLAYVLSAACEQLGWTAVMTDELLGRHGVVTSGLLTGTAWAGWHVVPYFQAHRPFTWVVWQCLFSIVFRVLMTQVYLSTGRSVFATIALHASYDTAFSMLPYYGSSYSPFFMTVVTSAGTLAAFGIPWASRQRTATADGTEQARPKNGRR